MTENNNPDNSTPTKKRSRLSWKGVGILFSTFAVIVLLYVFFAVNYSYIKYISKNQDQQENLLKVQKNMSDVEKQVRELADGLKSQAEMIDTLRQAQTGLSHDDWRVLEAEFLVQLANDKLQFENNSAQALALLQMADGKIRDLSDARLLPLRKALADDMAALQAVPQVDVAGLYMRLSAINEQIDKLPLPNKPVPSANVEVAPKENLNLPWWKRGLEQTWQELQHIVVVRYNESGKPPLVLPEQQDFLYQNLHAVMEKAMWGLLHQQPAIYRASLQQAANWIKQYFVNDAAVTQSVLKSLDELQTVDINPTAPKLSESLQAFHDFFAGVQQ